MASNSRILMALVFVLSCAGYVFPCTCGVPPLEEEFKESSAVFIGEITGLERWPVGRYEYSVKFKVDTAWKGIIGSEIEMFAAYDMPGMCNDLRLSPGEKYLVYADTDKDGCLYIARDCGPTANVKYAAEDVKRLQSKFSPRRPADLSAEGIGTGVLYVLSFLAGCFWLTKQRYEGR